MSGWKVCGTSRRIWRSNMKRPRRDLTARRKAAALQLATRVEDELKPLAMERTVFRIQIEPARVVRNRGGPGAVSGVAECGRGAEAAGSRGFGR